MCVHICKTWIFEPAQTWFFFHSWEMLLILLSSVCVSWYWVQYFFFHFLSPFFLHRVDLNESWMLRFESLNAYTWCLSWKCVTSTYFLFAYQSIFNYLWKLADTEHFCHIWLFSTAHCLKWAVILQLIFITPVKFSDPTPKWNPEKVNWSI